MFSLILPFSNSCWKCYTTVACLLYCYVMLLLLLSSSCVAICVLFIIFEQHIHTQTISFCSFYLSAQTHSTKYCVHIGPWLAYLMPVYIFLAFLLLFSIHLEHILTLTCSGALQSYILHCIHMICI